MINKTQCVFLEIEKNENALNQALAKMHVIARRMLGFCSMDSAQPFISEYTFKGNPNFDVIHAKNVKNNAIMINCSDYEMTDCDGMPKDLVVFVTMEKISELDKNDPIAVLINSILGEYPQEEINENLLATMLFNKYLIPMITLARKSSVYTKNWAVV